MKVHINPLAVILVVFTTTVGVALGSPAWGLAAGLGIVLVASFLP